MAEPMSDERLAEIRRNLEPEDGLGDDLAREAIELLAEAERLRAALAQKDAALGEVVREAAESDTAAQAALARVTDATKRLALTKGDGPYGAGYDDALAAIRAVAAGDQAEADDDDDPYGFYEPDMTAIPDGFSRCRRCGLDTPIDDQAAIEKHMEECRA